MDINKELKLDGADPSYIKTISRKYSEFLEYSQLPVPFYNVEAKEDSLPARIKILYNNIYTIIEDQLCFVFDIESYKNIGYLSSFLLDEYFKQAIQKNTMIKTIIYVDTNLVLDDYKKLMDSGEETKISLAHSRETLLYNLETADYVIWDKVSYITSTYDKQKFFNIISTRYRQGLGNMFFIKNAAKSFPNFCSSDLQDVMCFDKIIKLEDVQLKSSNKEGNSIQW